MLQTLSNDYEEGNFTPIVRGRTTAGTASYGTGGGKYTKVGRMVSVIVDMVFIHTKMEMLKLLDYHLQHIVDLSYCELYIGDDYSFNCRSFLVKPNSMLY